MAKQLAALLGGGLDLKALAEMLRRQGRGQDTILAHITPQEAALLKSRGGAGTMNPATGLPEFEDGGFLGSYEDIAPAEQQGFDNQVFSPETVSQPIDMSNAFIYSDPTDTRVASNVPDYTQDLYPAIQPAFRPSMNYGEGMTGAATETFDRGVQAQAPQRDFADMLKTGAKQVLGTREGLAGVGTLAAVLQARQAGRQADRMQREIAAIGAPQRALGQEMMRLGQAGQVTPVQRQQLEALAARERQQLAQRGLTSGTAAQQAQAQAVMREQRAAQDVLDQGLKIAGIGDQYQAAAIKAGYAADQATRDMLNTTLTNLYRTIYGNVQTPVTTSTTQTTPGGG